jgi:CheY-like chemotaxis protein
MSFTKCTTQAMPCKALGSVSRSRNVWCGSWEGISESRANRIKEVASGLIWTSRRSPPRLERWGSGVAVRGTRRRVLVVEDDPHSRGLFRDLRLPLGFELYEAADGEEGLGQAQAHRPDAVLMDMRMRGLDGLEATRRIRALPELEHSLIIAVSTSALRAQPRALPRSRRR